MVIQVIFLQPFVGVLEISDPVELQFGDQPVLHDTEASFDTSLGLGCQSGYRLDTKILQDSPNVSGILFSEPLLFHGPEVVGSG